MANQVRVFVSSPGDVAPERDRLKDAFARLNAEYTEQVVIEAIFWEEQFYAANRGGFQDQIVSPADCDLVICILWKRLGSYLPEQYNRSDLTARTGTEYEFETAMESAVATGRPDILLFRKSAPVLFSAERVDEEKAQYEALNAFWLRWMRDERGHFRGSFKMFSTPDEFVETVVEDLRGWLGERLQSAVWQRGSPFRGLSAFDVEHAPIFFGRERAIAEMRARLAASAQAADPAPLLLVVGPSGAGKSSVVRAGLIPDLVQRHRAPAIDPWRYVVATPSQLGDELDRGLARALYGTGALPELSEGDNDTPDALTEYWRASRGQRAMMARPLVAALDRWARALERSGTHARRPITGLLVVIDQFEEIFQLESRAQLEFATLLRDVASTNRVWIVLTLRSDMYPRLYTAPELLELKAGARQYDLHVPRGHELADIITRPAAAAGLRFERNDARALDDVLLDAAEGHPESLPLLEFVLEELYERRNVETGELTFAAYDQLGGLEGAIAQRAEEEYVALEKQLGDTTEHAFHRVMTAIAAVDDEGTVVRRWAPRSAIDVDDSARALADAFVAARLLVSDATPRSSDGTQRSGDEPRLGVAHEAVFRRWPRAVAWIDANDNHTFIVWRQRLRADVDRWRAVGEDAGALLRGVPLKEAERWLTLREKELDESEAGFVRQSAAQRDAELARERAQEQQLLKSARETLGSHAALQARFAVSDDPTVAMRLASRAVEQYPTDETRRVRAEIFRDHVFYRTLGAHPGPVTCLHVLADRILTGALDGVVRVWNPRGGLVRELIRCRLPVTSLGAADDGRRILVCCGDAEQDDHLAGIVDEDGKVLRTWNDKDTIVAAISPDGTHVLVAISGVADVFDEAGASVSRLDGHEGGISAVAFSRDGVQIAVAATDGNLHVWSVSGERRRVVVNPRNGVRSLTFAPDGRRLLAGIDSRLASESAGAANVACIWDIETEDAAVLTLAGHTGPVTSVAWSPAGDMVATGSLDKTARLWTPAGDIVATLRGQDGDVAGVAFAPDDLRVLTVSAHFGKMMAILGLPAGRQPDGRSALTGIADNTLRSWTISGRLLEVVHRTGAVFLHPPAALSRRGHVAIADSGGRVLFWPPDDEQFRELKAPRDTERMLSVALSPDGRWLAAGSGSYTGAALHLWDMRQNRHKAVSTGVGRMQSVAIAADGSLAAGAGGSLQMGHHGVEIVAARRGKSIAFHEHAVPVSHVAISPQMDLIAACGQDNNIYLYGRDGVLQRTFPAHVGAGRSAAGLGWHLAAFARGGAALLVVSHVDYSIRLCNLSGETQKIFRGHERGIASIAVSAEGDWFLTGSADGTARLWSLEDGEMHAYRGHPAVVTAVEFADDNQRIFTVDEKGTRRTWARRGAIGDLLASDDLQPLSLAAELAYGLRDPRSTRELDDPSRLYEAGDYFRFRLEEAVSPEHRAEYEDLIDAVEQRIVAQVIDSGEPTFPSREWRNQILATLVDLAIEKLEAKDYREAGRVAGVGERIAVADWDKDPLVKKTMLEVFSRLAPVYAGDNEALPRLTGWLAAAPPHIRKLADALIAHLAKRGLVHPDLQAGSGA